MQDIKRQAVTEQYSSTDGLSARIRFHERYNTNTEGWWPWDFRQIQEALGDGPKTILEIGSGRGDLWKQMQSQVPLNWKIRLTDASEAMVDTMKSRGLSMMEKIECRDALTAFSEASDLDAVIANHMLYCLTDEDRRQFFTLAAQHLTKRKGALCASTNGLLHLAEVWNTAREFDPALGGTITMRDHLSGSQAFCKENGAEQLNQAFSQVEWHDYGCVYEVDSAELLCNFVCSFAPLREIIESTHRQKEFQDFVQNKIHTHGPIKVTSVSGMFIARP